MSYPYHLSVREDGSETLFVFLPGHDPVIVGSDHPNYDDIRSAARLGDDPDAIVRLADTSVAVAAAVEHLSERVTVGGGRVYFDGDPVDTAITKHILRLLDEDPTGGAWWPLVAFLEKVETNPNEHSREQLYEWLREHEFTIAEDGDFIAYKGVNLAEDAVDEAERVYASISHGPAIVNGTPHHEGAVPQRVGDVVEIARSQVVHDPGKACGPGLHVASYTFASGFGGGATLKVKVNPRDVVSVPTRADKVRVCRYTVIEIAEAPTEAAIEYDEEPEAPPCVHCGDDAETSDGEGQDSCVPCAESIWAAQENEREAEEDEGCICGRIDPCPGRLCAHPDAERLGY